MLKQSAGGKGFNIITIKILKFCIINFSHSFRLNTFFFLYHTVSLFRYGGLRIEIPKGYDYVYYSTFIVGEYDFLRFKKEDTVLDAGAFIGDFTVKIARKVKEVVAVEPLPWAFKIQVLRLTS